MKYIQYRFDVRNTNKDILLAFLSELPFDAFEEQENDLLAYLAEAQFNEALEATIQKVAKERVAPYSTEEIPYQNWNQKWESNFEPIIVDDFVTIRAEFHKKLENTKHEIVINPKMAFGTGHHETTYMMLREMAHLSFKDASVMDYGCGTGILAIMAYKLGAQSIFAFDIQEEAYENSIENVELNLAGSGIELAQGQLDLAKGKTYDVILANINRNVILDSLETLYEMLANNGVLLISGILEQDGTMMEKEIGKARFSLVKRHIRNKWLCMSLKKI